MNDEKILTLKITEQYLADSDSVELMTFTAMEDAAAESLSKHKGDLNFGGLTSLSDATAKSLSNYNGYFDLSGLTSLSDPAA